MSSSEKKAEIGPRRILLVRTDRIGDVILSTPVAIALKKHFPETEVAFLVREYTRPLVQSCPAVDSVLSLESFQSPQGKLRIRALVRYLREQKFDAVVHLHPRAELAWAAWLAQIPKNIGTGYRFFSFLFSHRIYEHRKTAARHEAEYNLRLLRPLGLTEAAVQFDLRVDATSRERVEAILREQGIVPGTPLVVLHPGSGGSARDWPPEYFADLAQRVRQSGKARVVITGSADEKDLLEPHLQSAKMKPVSLAGRLSFKELAALLRRADVMVANSTGPLHLAVAVGTEVVAFYPPIRACRPERWGPYGRRGDVLMSQQEECRKCQKSGERYCACMRAIPVDLALERVLQKLGEISIKYDQDGSKIPSPKFQIPNKSQAPNANDLK